MATSHETTEGGRPSAGDAQRVVFVELATTVVVVVLEETTVVVLVPLTDVVQLKPMRQSLVPAVECFVGLPSFSSFGSQLSMSVS